MARTAAAVLIWLAALSSRALCESHRAGDLTLEPYSFRTFDGSAHPAELGRLWVRENRSGRSERLIQIAFVRLRSTAQKPQPPVAFLAGGPGVPGIAMSRVPVYYQLFERLQAISDVILVDQRGTGMSSPNTECPEGPPPPLDVFVKESSFLDALTARVRACADYWRAKGIDPADFNTSASADDLDDLRKALGAGKISLLAHSYGTSLALAAVRRHPERLNRVVLAGTVGPDRTLQMPLVFDFALRRLSTMAANFPGVRGEFPDTYREFQRVLAQLAHDPLPVRIRNERAKQETDLKVGPFLLQFEVKDMLPNGRRVGRIPALVYSLAHRDPALLAASVENLYIGFSSGFSAMQFAVSCSDGWSSARRQLAEEQASRSVFGDAAFVHLDPRVCGQAGGAQTQSESLAPIWSPVPTLFVTGTLDSNTPVYQAEEVLSGFANGVSVVIENGFHETLPSPDVQRVVAEFLSGADVRRGVIQFAPPRFLTIDEAKNTPQDAHGN